MKLSDKLLQPDITVVTVTQRLASYLQNQYDHWQFAQGKQAWQSINILPFHAWVERSWNSTGDTRIVLNDVQEHALWQRTISQSAYGGALLRLHATAQSAQQAWK